MAYAVEVGLIVLIVSSLIGLCTGQNSPINCYVCTTEPNNIVAGTDTLSNACGSPFNASGSNVERSTCYGYCVTWVAYSFPYTTFQRSCSVLPVNEGCTVSEYNPYSSPSANCLYSCNTDSCNGQNSFPLISSTCVVTPSAAFIAAAVVFNGLLQLL